MVIQDPLFYLVSIPAVLIYGMAKGGLGGGPAILSVPLMAMAVDPVQAAAILLPILCVMDLHAVKLFWKSYNIEILKIILPAALVGVVAGSLLLGVLAVAHIKIFLGVIVISFCLNYWLSSPQKNSQRQGDRISGYFWGFVAGITSTHIHAGGPPISIYLLPKNLDKVILIGTMAMFFAVLNFVKLVPYTLLNQFNLTNLSTSLVLMPLAPVGVGLGYMLLHRIKQELFYRVIYILLLCTGIKLILDGVLN